MTPITDHPEAFAKFVGSAARGYVSDALRQLDGHTISEDVLATLAVPGLADEVRRYAARREVELRRQIIIPAPGTVLPPVSGSPRAAYQLHHFDMLSDYDAAFKVLTRFGVRASLEDCSPEMVEHVRRLSKSPNFSAEIARHFATEVFN